VVFVRVIVCVDGGPHGLALTAPHSGPLKSGVKLTVRVGEQLHFATFAHSTAQPPPMRHPSPTNQSTPLMVTCVAVAVRSPFANLCTSVG